MGSPLYISGYGVVSTAGIGLRSLAGSLCTANGAAHIESLSFGGGSYHFARLPHSFGEGKIMVALAETCMEEVLQTSGHSMEDITGASTSFLLGVTAGAQKRWTGAEGPRNYRDMVSVEEFIEGYALEELTARFGCKGPSFAVNSACASSLSALTMACRLIRSGMSERALVGAIEVLNWYDVAGFSCAGLLSATGCKPFDKKRDGIMLGEAAVFVLVEKEADVLNPYCRICSFDSMNDLYDIAAPEPAGTQLKQCIYNTLSRAGLQPGEIDYVNAHGTGTIQNDRSESIVYGAVWPGKSCNTAISSTKGLHGHLRAAGGLLELLACGIAINDSVIPCNRGCMQQDEPGNWHCALIENRKRKVNKALSVSRGFGGSNVAMIVSAV